MPRNNRIFIAFAAEDQSYRNLFSGQKANPATPFNFTDMSVKVPFDDAWKSQCRSRIKGCDALIALVSKNLSSASGALWEIRCARELRLPIAGLFVSNEMIDRIFMLVPAELADCELLDWKWDSINAFLKKL